MLEPSSFHSKFSAGWQPEDHDPHDWTFERPEILKVLGSGLEERFPAPPTPGAGEATTSPEPAGPTCFDELCQVAAPMTPAKVDLRKWTGRVHHQGGFPTCNVHVVASLLEYFERRSFGRTIAPSRRFLFKVAKNFSLQDDESPPFIRQVMGVLKLIGVPPEKFWPYPAFDEDAEPLPTHDDSFYEEPPAFCYALAKEFQAIDYYRLDERNLDGELTTDTGPFLMRVKTLLAMNRPVTLGFPLYQQAVAQSWTQTPGLLPYPAEADEQKGAHAVVAVGYDDHKRVKNSATGGEGMGALIIQNSWGRNWGEGGFGYLAYKYILEDRTRDFWTLERAEWTETGSFQLGLVDQDFGAP